MQRLNSILASQKNRLHLAVALGAWLLLFVAWTLLRDVLPHPEITSLVALPRKSLCSIGMFGPRRSWKWPEALEVMLAAAVLRMRTGTGD